MEISPFSIAIDEEVLSDLRARIRKTRWPDRAPGAAWGQGTDLDELKRLLDFWANDFDWRAQERRLNTFRQFRVELEELRVHFVHERARRGDGLPLILTHGWPSTFAEYLPLVSLLTDAQAHGMDGPAFDVVIPSLPGYGFSTRPAELNSRQVARIWHRLMQGLGYERYGAGGGDFGASVATFMALDDPARLLGVHLSTLDLSPALGDGSRPLSAAEHDYLAQRQRWDDVERGYSAVQSTSRKRSATH